MAPLPLKGPNIYFLSMKVTFLGTGASSGTPVPGCDCQVCRSRDPRDCRLRPAVLVEWDGRHVLIDTPPELRIQLLSARVKKIDAILFTHCHADHVYGLDDVRIFSRERKIPVYGRREELMEIKKIFPYVFKRTQKAGGKPRLRLVPISSEVRLYSLTVVPLKVFHGNRVVYGYRLGDFAYIPDCSRIPPAVFKQLTGLSILVLDALRESPHPTHFSLSQSLEAAVQIGAAKTWFTHLSHNMDHAAIREKLPKGMDLAYDGLVLESDGPRA
jgi:phosphoribosyl 1,2-cyclic phosphate phosphodiesterase